MAHPTWPLFDLIIRTPMLELRIPREDEIVALASQADQTIYERNGFMPFHIDWTGDPIGSMKHFWRIRAEFSPEAWTLGLVPFIDGEPLGNQSLRAATFPVTRRFDTGSYLLAHAQGRGIGTEMRSAALHFAFEGLGALEAESTAHVDNKASNGVSLRLGYEVTHQRFENFGAERHPAHHLLLTRKAWEERRRDDIEIIGLDSCISMFGLPETEEAETEQAETEGA